MKCEDCKYWESVLSRYDEQDRKDSIENYEKLKKELTLKTLSSEEFSEQWIESCEENNFGYCHRYPPLFKKVLSETEREHWCGEFESK